MPRWIFHAIRMNQRGGNLGGFSNRSGTGPLFNLNGPGYGNARVALPLRRNRRLPGAGRIYLVYILSMFALRSPA
jgi:hypothetical protein